MWLVWLLPQRAQASKYEAIRSPEAAVSIVIIGDLIPLYLGTWNSRLPGGSLARDVKHTNSPRAPM